MIDDPLAMIGGLETESVDSRFEALDSLTLSDLVLAMNDAEAQVPAAVRRAAPQISTAIDAIVTRIGLGGRLIYVGAGTAGRLGLLDAAECPPTFSTPPDLIQGVIAGGAQAVVQAVENSEDDAAAGTAVVSDVGISALDAVVGISASGRTPYVLAAVEAAKGVGAITIGVSCNPNSELSGAVDVAIEVIVGPEFISGSTRLKAGSAQKQVLNMLSTISMIKLGKTYGNLMVGLSASNAKLRARAIGLVQGIASVPAGEAQAALESADYRVPVAAIVLVKGVSVEEAQQLLARADGSLRRVLHS